VSASDFNNDEHSEIATLVPKTAIIPFPVVGHCRNCLNTVLSSSPRSKPHICRWNFDFICKCNIYRDISISDFVLSSVSLSVCLIVCLFLSVSLYVWHVALIGE